MQCGDAIRVLRERGMRTLSDHEEAGLSHHLADCAACRSRAADPARDDTLEAPDLAYGPQRSGAASLRSSPEAIGAVPAPSRPDRLGSQPPTTDGGDDASGAEPARGESIGRFLVLGVLGSGGMGVVFSAYDPMLDRKVAIKLLRGSASRTDDNRSRLLREAQAMARIKHPNVIKVHEVGTHDGQVYVAMEFADQGTLRDWLAAAPRSRRDILAVFAQAGRGLAAAHAAGLVHRDFKPDNVLMSSDGGVLVTDFGLVAAIGEADEPVPTRFTPSRDTPLTRSLTRTGAVMGTPAYMAPEQFEGKASPATDQFAFCIALYEALYGERPFRGASYLELSAQVVTGDLGPAPKTGDVPGWLRKAIVRGLAADPAARYPGVAELLAALARDPARKRRRLTAAAIACAAIGAVVVLRGGEATDACETDAAARVTAAWNPMVRATLAAAFDASTRRHAQAALTKTEGLIDEWTVRWQAGFVDACHDTRVKADQSEALFDRRIACLMRRLDDGRATIDTLAAGGDDAVDHAIDVAAALPAVDPCADRAALLADVAPPDAAVAPEVAALRTALAEVRSQRELGRIAKTLALATPLVDRARRTGYLPVIGEALTAVGIAQHKLGDPAGVATLDEAMRDGLEAGDGDGAVTAAAYLVTSLAVDAARLDAAEQVAELAEATAKHVHPPAEDVVELAVATAFVLERRGHPDRARATLEHAVELATHDLGPDHPATLSALEELGRLAKVQGRFADARALLERVAAAAERTVGPDHPDYAHVLNELGNVARDEGKLDDAQKAYDRALAIRVAALGADSPGTAESYNSLGTLALERGDDATAKGYFEHSLAIDERAYGSDSVLLAPALNNVGNVYEDQQDWPAARQTYERVIALAERAHGPDFPELSGPINNLGNIAKAQKHYDEALALYQRSMHLVERVHGAEHPDVADALTNIATVYRAQGKLDDAESTDLRAIEVAKKAYGPTHTHVAMTLTNLAQVQQEHKRYDQALATYADALKMFETNLGKDHIYVSYALAGMGETDLELNRPADALAVLQRSLAIRVAAKSPPGMLAEVRYSLAKALYGAHQQARGLEEMRTAVAEYAKIGDKDDGDEARAWLRAHQ